MKTFVKIRSKHPSHEPLRKIIPATKKVVLRLGSTTPMPEGFIEINHKDVARISGNKKKMKQAFTEAGVKTALWIDPTTCTAVSGTTVFQECVKLGFPIVAKQLFGAQGKGNTLLRTEEELNTFLQGKTMSNYIFEKFYNYSREYRLHVTKDGCFYACRKMLKNDAPQEERWHRHESNSVWILEENPQFEKPDSWDDIIEDCVSVLDQIGADVLAFDIKVQSPVTKDGQQRDYQEYIIIECNSAPSIGLIGIEKYKQVIPKIIESKVNAG